MWSMLAWRERALLLSGVCVCVCVWLFLLLFVFVSFHLCVFAGGAALWEKEMERQKRGTQVEGDRPIHTLVFFSLSFLSVHLTQENTSMPDATVHLGMLDAAPAVLPSAVMWDGVNTRPFR